MTRKKPGVRRAETSVSPALWMPHEDHSRRGHQSRLVREALRLVARVFFKGSRHLLLPSRPGTFERPLFATRFFPVTHCGIGIPERGTSQRVSPCGRIVFPFRLDLERGRRRNRNSVRGIQAPDSEGDRDQVGSSRRTTRTLARSGSARSGT